jgi:pimeloyl-ACP methyl ester carboxylesterase
MRSRKAIDACPFGDGRMLPHRNPIHLLAVTILVGGCAAPIGIRTADPREVQITLTRSALTDDEPSDASLNLLRRYDLLLAYRANPGAALASLHDHALAEGLPQDALFALAELSFLWAEKTKRQGEYAATVVYAYALLFPEEKRTPLDPLDPRERITADLYNRALTLAFKRTEKGTIPLSSAMSEGRVVDLPFGRISVSLSPDMLQTSGSELYDFEPVAEIEVEGLRNRYRRAGIGAPLAAKTRPLQGVVPVVPVGPFVRVPLSAVMIIDSPLAGIRTGELIGRLELFTDLNTETIEIGGHAPPLEMEPTAALAASLAESQFWKRELRVFLGDALGVRGKSSLAALRPYQKGRIPVVLVHGTASSPARWANMVNDLVADPRLRTRYTFWLFKYDSGNPIVYSGYQLREALTQAVERADPSGVDPCVRDMVVMGHSQGGLLTKLAVVDSGDAFWTNVTNTPFDEVALKPDDKELLRNVMFVKPLPFVTEVLFLATPHRGSYLAGPQFVRRLAGYLVSLPSEIVRVGATVTALASAGAGGLQMPTSIDNMSPGHPFIKKLAGIPVAPTVTAHSIIAVDDDSPIDRARDGVVKYESAHVDGVTSELIVRSAHSGMQDAPQTIEEVRRILLEHSARSACPRPPD